jgi:MFS superfamily sulfate permease-like transporter
MKAIAAVAIAEGLLVGEIAAAGIVVGGAVFLLGAAGAVGWVSRRVPKALVRGIQLGIGVKLALKGVEWLTGVGVGLEGVRLAGGIPLFGPDSLLVAGVVAVLLLLPSLRRMPVLVAVFVAGFGLVYLADPAAFSGMGPSFPSPRLVWPAPADWSGGILRGAVPQLPLTLLNSVIAVCALSADYFPGRGIAPRRMAMSVGVMNLLCVPFGGMPMCHGAGGLAAQVRFGARTGGSVVLLGSAKLVAGVLFGGALVSLLGAYPRSILAVLLMFAGWSLASVAGDSMRRGRILTVLVTAAGIVGVNTMAGFLAGLFVWLLFGRRACACERTAGSERPRPR